MPFTLHDLKDFERDLTPDRGLVVLDPISNRTFMISDSVQILSTPESGRGVYAKQDISKDTVVQVCDYPFAFVILRKFRKEVCGWCFRYAFESGRTKWNVKRDEMKGIWFCSDPCLELWNLEYRGIDQDVRLALELFEKACSSSTKGRSASVSLKFGSEINDLDDLDRFWHSLQHTKELRIEMEEEEFNMARFVLEGIFRRCLQDLKPRNNEEEETWTSLTSLQSSDPFFLPCHPIFSSHAKVYLFLSHLLATIPLFKSYLASHETTRTILSRHHSNAFGIWEERNNDQSGAENEMLGYGLYVSASYFNHDCCPNIRKLRKGRQIVFITTRDVPAGEQLCTTYVDVDQGERDRRKELKEWGFDCVCERCSTEASLL